MKKKKEKKKEFVTSLSNRKERGSVFMFLTASFEVSQANIWWMLIQEKCTAKSQFPFQGFKYLFHRPPVLLKLLQGDLIADLLYSEHLSRSNLKTAIFLSTFSKYFLALGLHFEGHGITSKTLALPRLIRMDRNEGNLPPQIM